MVNRPAGGARSKQWGRAPHDFYREHAAVVEQLMHRIDFGDDLIWDPCCGKGNVLDVAKRYGHLTFGSDLIDRSPDHPFMRKSAFDWKSLPLPVRTVWARGREVSIISNTPYNYEPQIAERIIAHMLETMSDKVRRFAFIVPIAFLVGQQRWRREQFQGRWRASHACFFTERPTMPPGHLIDEMPRPYEGGMADYAALVFTPPHRWRTEAIWLPPGRFPDRPRRPQPKKENESG